MKEEAEKIASKEKRLSQEQTQGRIQKDKKGEDE